MFRHMFGHMMGPRKLLYAFFLLYLISPMLMRLKQERLKVILVALDHVTAPWYEEMTQVLAKSPWTLTQY